MTSIAPQMSIEGARRQLARELRSHGLETPELDARLLVGHALGLDHGGLITHARCLLASDQAQAVAALAARRLARASLAIRSSGACH
jgi:release factor glutamine methyltransferase